MYKRSFIRRIIVSLTIFLCLCIINFNLKSQTSLGSSSFKKDFDISKLSIGGDLGCSFGTVTVVDVSPIVSYRFTRHLSAGIGGVYKYYNDKRYNPPDQRTVWGGSIFTRANIILNIFAQAEYEYLAYKTNYFSLSGSDQWISEWGLLVGGGYRQRLGLNSYIFALILYNLNETKYTPYENPVVRIGVEFGL